MSDDLLVELARFQNDPWGFVMWAFPWNEPGELEARWPEPWQEEELKGIGQRLQAGESIVLEATASGHGVGKSCLTAWIILWAFATLANTKGVVTANTENQLKTKTWAEVAKWFGMFIAKDLFELDATCLKVRSPQVEERVKWKVDMVPWSERNTEAFAGMHNLGRRVLLLMDEASSIPDVIWEVSEGVLTDHDTQIIWCVFGNPTRNKGRFWEVFEGRFQHRWHTRRVDSRTVSFTNKSQIEKWVNDYGEDSDFVRVRVRGVFPRVDAESFISHELALEAVNRDVEPGMILADEPLIIGVDVGRFGDDPSVLVARRGRDATLEWEVIYNQDTMNVAARAGAMALRWRAAALMVDGGGVGGGVVDRLRHLGFAVWDVDFGSSPDTFGNDGVKLANKRAEIWHHLKEWLKKGKIPSYIPGSETSLIDDLTAPRYGFTKKQEALLLESKAEMRRRGVKSPNLADALACTFAFPVYTAPVGELAKASIIQEDYNPYTRERLAS